MATDYEITISGEVYHKKKDEFHKLLDKYNLKWKGKFPNFRWFGIGQAVVASFVRENGETKEATIRWLGVSETQFLSEMKKLFKEE